jgi:hypothetical protein
VKEGKWCLNTEWATNGPTGTKAANMFMLVVVILCGLFAVFLARAPITPAGKMLILACVPVGGVLGFALGMVTASEVLNMGNLSGLFAVLITGPIGAIAGGVAGWFTFRRRFATLWTP